MMHRIYRSKYILSIISDLAKNCHEFGISNGVALRQNLNFIESFTNNCACSKSTGLTCISCCCLLVLLFIETIVPGMGNTLTRGHAH